MTAPCWPTNNYIRESILNPNAKIVSGSSPSCRPSRASLKEDDLVQLIAYIKSMPTVDAGPNQQPHLGRHDSRQ